MSRLGRLVDHLDRNDDGGDGVLRASGDGNVAGDDVGYEARI